VVAGLGRATPALTTLRLVEDDVVCIVPLALLQHFARRSDIELSEHGRRKLGLLPISGQGLIGRQIGGEIGKLIGAPPEHEGAFSPPERAERLQRPPRPTIPGILRDSSASTPPPTPPAPGGGGRQKPLQRRAGAPKPHAAPVPETDATRLLRTISVRPAQQIELAGMALTVVEAAIADGRARQGIRDLAGWVVYLLRQRRDHGWSPPPHEPRPDEPEALGAYFAQLAAEQAAGQAAKQVPEPPSAECPSEELSTSAQPTPPVKAAQPPSLAKLWQDTLATLRLRLPREVYQACARRATLIDVAGDMATIGTADARLKDALGHQYGSALRLALGDALGHEVAVRVVLRMPT
jgi:hypothetical protein